MSALTLLAMSMNCALKILLILTLTNVLKTLACTCNHLEESCFTNMAYLSDSIINLNNYQDDENDQ